MGMRIIWYGWEERLAAITISVAKMKLPRIETIIMNPVIIQKSWEIGLLIEFFMEKRMRVWKARDLACM